MSRTVASLLAVIVVLLGLDLIARGSSAVYGAPTGPAPPTVVGLAATTQGSPGPANLVYRLWSDGAVDVSAVAGVQPCAPFLTCGPFNVIKGGSCAADLTHNGAVEIGDFLEVLGQWGPCQ
jgi:hypothetical protein